MHFYKHIQSRSCIGKRTRCRLPKSGVKINILPRWMAQASLKVKSPPLQSRVPSNKFSLRQPRKQFTTFTRLLHPRSAHAIAFARLLRSLFLSSPRLATTPHTTQQTCPTTATTAPVTLALASMSKPLPHPHHTLH